MPIEVNKTNLDMTDILPEAQQLVNAEFETSNPACSPKSLAALKTFAILRFVPSHRESEIKNLAFSSGILFFFLIKTVLVTMNFTVWYFLVVFTCTNLSGSGPQLGYE